MIIIQNFCKKKEEANDVKPTKGRIFSYYQNRKKLSKIEQNSSMKNDSNNIPTTNNNNNIFIIFFIIFINFSIFWRRC